MILAQPAGVFNGANENGTRALPSITAVPPYSVRSYTTSEGIRAHTVKTKSTALAIAFFGAALDVDDEPLEDKVGKWYFVHFYSDDAECDRVIANATGGKA